MRHNCLIRPTSLAHLLGRMALTLIRPTTSYWRNLRRRPDKAKPSSGNPHHNHTVNDSTFSNAARSVSGVNVTGRA